LTKRIRPKRLVEVDLFKSENYICYLYPAEATDTWCHQFDVREKMLRNAVRVACNVSHARLFVLENVVASVEEAFCFVDGCIEDHPVVDVCIDALRFNSSASKPRVDCFVCLRTIS